VPVTFQQNFTRFDFLGEINKVVFRIVIILTVNVYTLEFTVNKQTCKVLVVTNNIHHSRFIPEVVTETSQIFLQDMSQSNEYSR
jgi:hypothetical protein